MAPASAPINRNRPPPSVIASRRRSNPATALQGRSAGPPGRFAAALLAMTVYRVFIFSKSGKFEPDPASRFDFVSASAAAARLFSWIFAITAWLARSNEARLSVTFFKSEERRVGKEGY